MDDFILFINKLNLHNEVKLIIQDNGSDVPPNIEQFENVECHYLPQNIGADANFLKLFEMANSKYTWLFGDDDRIEIHSFAKIIRVLKQSEPDILFIPKQEFSRDVRLSGGKLLKRVLVHSTFISSHVISTNLINLNDVDPRIKNLNYWGLFLNAYIKARDARLVASTCLIMRSDASGGYDFLKTWINEYNYLVNRCFLPKLTKLYLKIDRSISLVLPFMLTLRAKKSRSTFKLNYNGIDEQYLGIFLYRYVPIIFLKCIDYLRKFMKVVFYWIIRKIK